MKKDSERVVEILLFCLVIFGIVVYYAYSDNTNSFEYTFTTKKELDKIVDIVDNTSPTITLNGESEITIYVGEEYKEEGATVSDNFDINLNDKLIIEGNVDTNNIGEYTVNYKVYDNSGNLGKATRKVKVIERLTDTKVTVLNYHFFYENNGECNESICEKTSKFKEQLQYLKDNGYKTLTMKEFVDWMYGKINLPDKAVLITIDDGAFGTGKHNGNYLIPILEEYQVNATLFLITGWWDINNYNSPYLDIESHTHDLHIEENCGYRSKVNCVDHDKLVADLRESIDVTNSSLAFCFPFYEYTNDSINAVKEVGFKVAFIGGNRKVSRNDDKYKIPRYIIYNSTSLTQFINMVN